MKIALAALLLVVTGGASGHDAPRWVCVREEGPPLIRGYRLPPLPRLGPARCYQVDDASVE